MPDINVGELEDLRQEQARLRADLERLRQSQAGGDGQGKNSQEKDGQVKDGQGKDGAGKKDDQKDKDKQEQEEPKPPFLQRMGAWVRTHPLLLIGIVFGLAVLLIGGWFLWQYLQTYESTDDAQINGHIDQISPRINGTVVAIYVEDTQGVVKGQSVVDLDPRDYQVALEQAQARFAQAVSSLRAQSPNVPITETSQATSVSTAQANVRSAEAAVAAAQRTWESSTADFEQAQANAANSDAEEKRYAQLVAKQEVSRELYDQRATQARADQALVRSRERTAEAARRNVDEQQAALDSARDSLLQAQANLPRQVAVQRATVQARQADVETAQAQINQAMLNLSYCKIVAPVDGIVGDKTIEAGMQVAPGQELFAITRTDDIWVDANFKETQIRNMHPGQSVTITVDALAQAFDGYIENMPGATGAKYSLLPPENATGNYVKVVQRLPVRIRFKQGQRGAERLRPGMSVEPKVWVR